MEPRVIKNHDEYEAYMEEASRLLEIDPELGSREGDRLELLALLIEDYEKNNYPIENTDPVSAILFRMQEQGLKQKDLIPYLGSKSRVSEVLSGKRQLSIQMIRALNTGLGIPAEILISAPSNISHSGSNIDWDEFPIKEIAKRQWLNCANDEKEALKELINKYLFNISSGSLGPVLLKRTFLGNAIERKSKYSLYAWVSRVLQKASNEVVNTPKSIFGDINESDISDLVKLSSLEEGPLLAIEKLKDIGVKVIIEPHMPYTKLDGAAMLDEGGCPIIGLTIRYDRIDNFWFTLMHELAHIILHINNNETAYLDDVEIFYEEDEREREANRFARDNLIPRNIWKRSSAYRYQTKASIYNLSKRLKIHPGIIAGRIRREKNDFRILSDLIGQGEVRKLFKNISWT